ncbi:MAG: GNAT family N-acetyltransferase, partial [Flavobacteriales bacterium]
CESAYPGQGIRISAQCYLEKFYANLGFSSTGETYLEDNIPHIQMFRPSSS